MNCLIYVSNNAILPDNKLNPFFAKKKEWLLENNGEFYVVCPKGLYVCQESGQIKKMLSSQLYTLLCVICIFFDKNVYIEIKRMMSDHKCTAVNILKILRFSYQGSILEMLIKKIIHIKGRSNYILYSYWLSYDAYACSKIKAKYKNIRAISRAHAFEIQLHRNSCNPYLMKHYICQNLDKIAFISENAKDAFGEYYKEELNASTVIYIGSTKKNTGYIQRSKSDTLTILSCSSIIPIKRLDYMVEAIKDWENSKIHWIHVGSGPLMDNILQMAKEKLSSNDNVSYQFLGSLDNAKVHEVMKNIEIDAFVNMSESEGVPVSIMEAMSCGIPIIAPSIFGIPELVNTDSGILFDSSKGIQEFQKSIKLFNNLSNEQRIAMGKNAYYTWKEKFCLEDNLSLLFEK